MKNLLKMLGLFLVITIVFAACSKEELTSLPISDESDGIAGERNDDEVTKWKDIEQAIELIQDMKNEVDGWKVGEKLSNSRSPEAATEMVEVIWNFYVSRPEFIYEQYETVRGTLTSAVESDGEWNGTEILSIYNNFKEKVESSLNSLDGSNNGIVMLDLSQPLVESGKAVIDYTIMIGIDRIRKPLKHASHETRWAGDPLGFTDVECTGRANDLIGQIVNSNIGIFFQNLPPLNPGNPGTPGTFIIGPVQSVQTNYFGTTFPLGGAVPPLFVNATTDFPTGNTQATDYPIRGEFMVHADVSFTPTLPDENCFSIVKIGNYALDNKALGDSYLPDVVASAPPIIFIPPFIPTLPYRLIGTYVGANAQAVDNPITPAVPDVYLQEHPTYHFYAGVFRFFFLQPAPVAVSLM